MGEDVLAEFSAARRCRCSAQRWWSRAELRGQYRHRSCTWKALGSGAMLAGLLVSAGVGLLVLVRTNRHLKENIAIIVALRDGRHLGFAGERARHRVLGVRSNGLPC
ncbi:MAG: hypothetical protein ACLSVD_18065 [Eggerthellaceae bacterium]